jgi:selenocysteine lyase/cysteine desulfurase
MGEAGIDILTIAGHKGMMGIQGSGALLFSEKTEIEPLHFGGTGSISLSLDMPDFYPDKLEVGTLSFPSIISLLEGTRYLKTHLQEVQEKLLRFTDYFLQRVSSIKGYLPYSKSNPCGIVAFKHHSLQSERLADILSTKYNIALRGGLHCAPLAHEDLGTLDGGLLRASFSIFNTEKEIDSLLFALEELK